MLPENCWKMENKHRPRSYKDHDHSCTTVDVGRVLGETNIIHNIYNTGTYIHGVPWGLGDTSGMHSTGWNTEEILYNHRSENALFSIYGLQKNSPWFLLQGYN